MDRISDNNDFVSKLMYIFVSVKMLFTDPRLAIKCVFGPATAYQYRLEGPRPWSGARDAILRQLERTFYPLTDGRYSNKEENSITSWILWLILCVFVMIILKLFW